MSFNPQNFYLKRLGNCDFKVKYRNYSFVKAETMFGRGRDCDFVLRNMRCSLNHCKITFENGRIYIEDSSSAGTFVNDEKIIGRKVELLDGTIVGMGADPKRPEHVDKSNFYIYQVKKVEAPISLDSSDEDETEQVDKIPISSSSDEIETNKENVKDIDKNVVQNDSKQSTTSVKIDKKDSSDSDDTICLENEENVEDLTQKIDEHLHSNQIGEQLLAANDLMIKTETFDMDSAIQRLLELGQKLGVKRNSVSKTSAPNLPTETSGVDLQPEWISSAFISDSATCNQIAASSTPAQPAQCKPSELDQEPPIFTPGPSNFQPIPSHLADVTSLKSSKIISDQQLSPLKLAEAPNYLPNSSALTQPPANDSPTPSTSGRRMSNLALRKKVLTNAATNSSTSTPLPLNYSPISSTSNLSSTTLSTISSEKLQSFSRSSSTNSSTSLPSSEEQPKPPTTDEIKAKTNYLRHYGQQCTKLIDLPENPLNQTCDLLDEVESPKEAMPIFWKKGIAMIKPTRKPKKKRGRQKKSDDDKNAETSENSNGTENSKKVLKPKISDKSTKTDDNASKARNVISESENSSSESSNISSPTKLKSTARKTSTSGAIVVKRPLACVNDNKSSTEDTASSNEYQSAQSGNSESENQEEKAKIPKKRKISTKEPESSKNDQESKIKASIPTSSNSKKLEKFPDSDEDKPVKLKDSKPAKIAPKRKIQRRRESTINLNRPVNIKNLPEDYQKKLDKHLKNKDKLTAQQSSTHQDPNSPTSPNQKFYSKFPNLYQGIVKSDSASPSPSGSPIPMKKRRQSVFEEQRKLIDENLTPNERSDALRRWKKNTTKLIAMTEDPNKKRRGRPKLNEDDKIRKLVEKNKANEEKK